MTWLNLIFDERPKFVDVPSVKFLIFALYSACLSAKLWFVAENISSHGYVIVLCSLGCYRIIDFRVNFNSDCLFWKNLSPVMLLEMGHKKSYQIVTKPASFNLVDCI